MLTRDQWKRAAVILIALVAICSALAGCATANQWTRPGASAAQAEADLKVCRYQAELGIGSGQQTQVYGANMGAAIGTGISDGIADAIRVNRLQSLCMEAGGYGRRS